MKEREKEIKIDKMMRKIDALPIGYSDVERVIRTGYYVDKTRYAQELIEKENPVFIARPRRFGKSLFINTLATICSGEKEIFKDCYIGQPENGYEWRKYPVIDLDFSRLTNDTPEELKESIKKALKEIAFLYELKIEDQTVKGTLQDLIMKLMNLQCISASSEIRSSDYESKIVVLIDEYDAPIVHLTKGSDLEKSNIKVMKDFFMTLKSFNKYFQLTLITGVSKFSLSDVFSGTNHLKDITIDASADAMFGYTQQEIVIIFSKNLEDIAKKWSIKENKNITPSEVMGEITTYYNGYKFYEDGLSVYNPWSTLRFLDAGKLENYWYESGSPSLLINQMLVDPDRFDFQSDNLQMEATRDDLMYTGSRSEIGLKSLMFQTGYLTIHNYDDSTGLYILKFPNKEIEASFQKSIKSSLEKSVKDYFIQERDKIRSALANKKIEMFIEHINTAFATLPYYIDTKQEKQYHSNLHMLLQGLGFLGGRKMHMHSESVSSQGRSDIVLESETAIYIIEIKYRSSGKIALAQIKANGYYKPYLLRQKSIILLGINFNEETRMIDNWAYEIHEEHLKQ
ncbi:putative AAA-ATPase [Cardinium endosymbiont of Sogatella furcifera]|uniref:AAA family ATPase n=1 Tax=Cardinium endosymbiont of Sogatella furcifera TaxID=650378 RepID=UPI000E0D0CCF|nr:AAA family ATPase [Cardinium endosymbiont of Sogatella furcifera]AXI23964.1 putative AAA-ATPase [Cardinium endosymbiont of Sogatella furcifera]